MRYVVAYVSTADPNLSTQDVKDLLENATEHNNGQNITGILLFTESNFFQLLEGEERKIKNLYSRIEKDSRHKNIIKFLEKPAFKPTDEGYANCILTNEDELDDSQLDNYLKYLQVLDPDSRKDVQRVMEAILI